MDEEPSLISNDDDAPLLNDLQKLTSSNDDSQFTDLQDIPFDDDDDNVECILLSPDASKISEEETMSCRDHNQDSVTRIQLVDTDITPFAESDIELPIPIEIKKVASNQDVECILSLVSHLRHRHHHIPRE